MATDTADPTDLTQTLAAIRASGPGKTASGGVASSVSVTNFPATQPVSAASLPLPAGAATDGTDITTPTAMPAGGVGIRGWLSAIWTKLNGTIGVTGTFWQATQPVSGTFWQATQPVSLATNTPDVTDRAARLLGHVTVDAQPTLTKGTQGGTGVSTQDLKDAGRTPIVLSVTAVASVASEAMFTLNQWKNGTVTTGTSYTVTAGKTLRIQAIQLGARFATPSTTVTFANCRFNIRSGSLITSPLIYGDSKLASSNMPTPNSDLAVPDGLEVAAGSVIGVSHVDSATTLLLDLLIVGYEY